MENKLISKGQCIAASVLCFGTLSSFATMGFVSPPVEMQNPKEYSYVSICDDSCVFNDRYVNASVFVSSPFPVRIDSVNSSFPISGKIRIRISKRNKI